MLPHHYALVHLIFFCIPCYILYFFLSRSFIFMDLLIFIHRLVDLNYVAVEVHKNGTIMSMLFPFLKWQSST